MRKTAALVKGAEERDDAYFSLLFHDRYFSAEFPLWRKWYADTIGLLLSKGHRFISHIDAARLFYNNAAKEKSPKSEGRGQ